MNRPDGLSIKEVADLAGVTTRAVRHYHSIGLLPEPPRDRSGYRRYGGKDVIALVRITRLRALGMPLPQIAERVADAEDGDTSLAGALRGLADELDGEIAQLIETRDRLRKLADSQTFVQPVKALTQALQERGVLGPSDELRAGEGWVAAVLDALHPEGMPGILAEASRLLADPQTVAALRPLRRRLVRLNARTPDAEIAALADEVARVIPRSELGGPLFDLRLIDLVLTDGLNPTQKRFVEELHARLEKAQ
jgi:DNA-binding transcriptional MerR regulator